MGQRRAAQNDLRRPYLRRGIGSFISVFVLFYIGFHAVNGDHGLLALFRESRKLETLKAELAEVTAEHAEMDRKVKLLSSNSLDLDMLDERARLVLGFAGKSEAVYFLNTK